MTRTLVVALVLLTLASCGRKTAPDVIPGTLFANFGAGQTATNDLQAELDAQIAIEKQIAGVKDDTKPNPVLQ